MGAVHGMGGSLGSCICTDHVDGLGISLAEEVMWYIRAAKLTSVATHVENLRPATTVVGSGRIDVRACVYVHVSRMNFQTLQQLFMHIDNEVYVMHLPHAVEEAQVSH